MKRSISVKFLSILILLISLIFSGLMLSTKNPIFANSNDSEILENDDIKLSKNYLDFYSISSSNFTYSNNGGELSSNKLSYAFDRNFNTSFKSSIDNNVPYTDPDTNETIAKFINYIDIDFNQNVSIDRVLYGSETGMTRGYPTTLNIYANLNDSLSLIKTFTTTETSKMVVFDLGESVTTNQIRFEYVTVAKGHKWVASAREIIFLQPENNLFSVYNNMFTDYCELSLNSNVNTLTKLAKFESELKNNINYETLKPRFERATKILNKELTYQNSREFSTNPNSLNVINQFGNVDSYCRNTLKMSSFGTNRQVIGITAKPYETVTIYIDCDDSDPLPSIRFSQNHGHWSGWLSGNYSLKKGVNYLTVPYLKNSNYTIDTVSGGAIYIVNPYFPSEQSQNVKVYIESGETYPVYRKGQDEKEFLNELNTYYENLQQNPTNTIDITEIVTDHIIFSGSASKAHEIFTSFSPKQCAENWDNYLDSLLSFGGLDCDESGENYNPINKHLNANVRVSQPWSGAAAYTYTEHIGIYTSWEATGYYASNFGWGMSHELGHMFDTRGQIVGECSNNMYAKYNETVLENIGTRGNFDATFNALSDDDNLPSSYFNDNRQNFLIWWYIECYHHGYWGELQNCYRGFNKVLNKLYEENDGLQTKVESLNSTERQIFYSSIVTKIDMSYYFARWGYNLSTGDEIFSQETMTDTLKDCLQVANDSNYIDSTKKPKLWYQDNTQYKISSLGDCNLYNGTEKPVLEKVIKGNSGNNVYLNQPNDIRHLGYEIWQGDETNGYKLVAFTTNGIYLDTNSYETSPLYKIRAYDRMFNTTDYSSAVRVTEFSQSNVCKINDTYYDFIYDAINNAQENDVIELLKSTQEKNLIIDKNLTIKIGENLQNISIFRTETGDLFTINSGKTLTLLGENESHLVINGGNILQNGSLFVVSGTFIASNVDFMGNKTSSNGGAVKGLNGGVIQISNSKITNNSAIYGGAIHLDYASNRLTLADTEISNNSSKNNGGAILNKGTIVTTNCVILDNTTQENGVIYNYGGGILKLNSTTIKNNLTSKNGAIYIDGYTEINNSTITQNSALNNGGGIYYSTSVDVRELIINGSIVAQNSANSGKDIYLDQGKITLKNTATINGDIYVNNGSLIINMDSLIYGQINQNLGLISLNDGLFESLNQVNFNFINKTDDLNVIKFEGFEFNEEDLTCFNVINDNIKLIFDESGLKLEIIQPVIPTEPDVPTNNENNLVKIIVIVSSILIGLGVVVFIIFMIKIKIVKDKKLRSKRKNVRY